MRTVHRIAALLLAAACGLAAQAQPITTMIDDFSTPQESGSVVTGPMRFDQRQLTVNGGVAAVADGSFSYLSGFSALLLYTTQQPIDFGMMAGIHLAFGTGGLRPQTVLRLYSGGSLSHSAMALLPARQGGGLEWIAITELYWESSEFDFRRVTGMLLAFAHLDAADGPMTLDAVWVEGTLLPAVPEPAPAALLAGGLALLGLLRRRA